MNMTLEDKEEFDALIERLAYIFENSISHEAVLNELSSLNERLTYNLLEEEEG